MSGRTQQDRGCCWYFPVVSKFKEQAMLLYLWVKSLERRILAAATLVFALALLPIQSQCQPSEDTTSSGERSIEFGFESDLVSRYVWHGLEWSTGSVSQNTLWLSAHNITASLWANSDLVARADGPLFNELDLSLAHELSYRALTFESSAQVYLYYPLQPDWPWTAELSIAITAKLPVASPFIRQTFDVKEYPGSYFGEFGLSFEQQLGQQFSLDVAAEIGWASAEFNDAYVGVPWTGVQLYQFEAGLTYFFTNSLYLRPHWCWSNVSSDVLQEAIEKSRLYQISIAFGGQF